jgi:hypothetical protein
VLRSLKYTILLSRPYSWVNTILIGISANILARGTFVFDILMARDVCLSMFMWVSGMAVLEFMHNKYEYFEENNKYLSFAPIVFFFVLTAFLVPHSVGVLCLFVASVALYSLKTKRRLGRVSFLFRGFSEVSIVLLILCFYGANPLEVQALQFMTVLYFFTVARNLIGDIRDVSVDENTLPAIHPNLSYALAGIFAAIPLLFVENVLQALPVAAAILTILLRGRTNAYRAHRALVVYLTLYLAVFLYDLGAAPLFTLGLAVLGVVLSFTYDSVPRKLGKVGGAEQVNDLRKRAGIEPDY